MSSRGLSKSEKNYSGPKKELLAFVYHIQWFKVYVWGRHFIARVDHRALKWLDQWKDKGILAKWFEMLADYNFTVVHVPGKAFGDVDALSRQEHSEPPESAMQFIEKSYKPAGVPRVGQHEATLMNIKEEIDEDGGSVPSFDKEGGENASSSVKCIVTHSEMIQSK